MISALILGCLLGIATGLLPGLGLFSGLILVYPYLKTLEVQNILIFYISMAAASQYMGSVSAIVLKIPGEANSIFALREAKILEYQGLSAQAIGACAVGSLFGGIGAVILTFLLLPFLEPFVPYMFRSDIKIAILLLSLSAFIYFAENKILWSLVLAVVGFALSMIGVDPYGNERTFGFDALLGGIPWYPVVLGIMIVPKLLFDKTQLMLSSTAVKFYFNFATVIRSTLLGYIGGLVPGISYIIGPKLAWIVENKISQNPLKRLLAAETANNASYYSMIVPLLLLSVPIVSSEAIILELANNKGFQFNWNTIITSGWFASTVAPIISINLLLGLISFFCVKWLIFWKNLPKINLVVSALLFVSLIFNANNIHYELLVFVISFIIGIMLRNFDVLPLILTFIIGDQIEQNLIRFLTINNFI